MANTKQTEARHPIQVVARRTGLSAEVLRVWEKRYGVVRPKRTAGGRRFYSDEDLDRLRLLRQVTAAGRRIGEVSGLRPEELRALIDEDDSAAEGARVHRQAAPVSEANQALVDEALRAVEVVDENALEAVLSRGLLVLTAPEVVEDVVAPLLRRIGQLWREGGLDPYHEHFATLVIRRVMGQAIASVSAGERAPAIAIATPAKQYHDLGALLAAFLAAAWGWRVTYLGADLPAVDIARAARQKGVEAVALSLIHPADDPDLANELTTLRKRLPDDIALIVGGAVAPQYAATLRRIAAIVLTDLRSMETALAALWDQAAARKS